ncbi:sporulation protein YunB [Virgibacillus doumboii]|uniref:sporulation protein YunB n=1 Tax=Virgibacillus doumboii TaxID=2697503 RepID=UPI0013DEC6F6|nr:sporulation protein YunB [Virgibacillus doumboii]
MLRQLMLFRRNRKTRTPPPVKNIFVLTMVIFAGMVGLSIWVIDQGIRDPLMDIAKQKTNEFASRAINSAVRFAEDYQFEDILTTVTEDDEGNITSLGWNQNVISEINRVATDRVEEFFISMNEGRQPRYEEQLHETPEYDGSAENLPKKDPTVVEIPIGQATGNTVLANLGPRVPVNLQLTGAVRTDVVTEQQDIGINGAIIEIYLMVEADVQVIVPFSTDVTEVKNKIYIDQRVIMGDIPEFFGGNGENPSISIPKDSLQKQE